MKKLLIALSAFAAVSLTLASEKFDLWPEGKMPGKSAAEPESSKIEDTWIGKKDKVLIIRNVSKPTLEFFKAKSDFVLEDEILAPLTRIDKLPDGHPAKEYVRGRLIPRDKWRLLYYSDDFMGYVNSFKAGKFSNPFKEERLIIPYFDEHGRVFAMQGRALDPEASVRYFTVKVDDNAERVFGIERLDYSKPIYITEGPLDSLFLPNALAVSGSSFESPFVEGLKTNATLVFDNEPRSPQICKLIHRMLVKGFRVCLWNANITFKDINEGILAGFTTDEIVDIIERSSVKGVAGLARFSLWKKC